MARDIRAETRCASGVWQRLLLAAVLRAACRSRGEHAETGSDNRIPPGRGRFRGRRPRVVARLTKQVVVHTKTACTCQTNKKVGRGLVVLVRDAPSNGHIDTPHFFSLLRFFQVEGPLVVLTSSSGTLKEPLVAPWVRIGWYFRLSAGSQTPHPKK
jgi:plasmid stabilization system protein ParE